MFNEAVDSVLQYVGFLTIGLLIFLYIIFKIYALNEISKNVDDIKHKVENMQDTVNNIKAEMVVSFAELKNKVDDLEYEINKLKKKKR